METYPNTSSVTANESMKAPLARTAQKSSTAAAHSEGPVALAIEQQTAKLPSDFFLWAACGTIAASLAFQAAGMLSRKPRARLLTPTHTPPSTFIGMWTSTFLLLGIYNKLVKVAGSDQLRR